MVDRSSNGGPWISNARFGMVVVVSGATVVVVDAAIGGGVVGGVGALRMENTTDPTSAVVAIPPNQRMAR